MNMLHIALPRRLRALRLHAQQHERHVERQRAQRLSSLAQKAEHEASARDAMLSCIEDIERQLEAIPMLVAANLEQVSDLATEIGLAVAREIVGSAVEQGLVDTTAVVRRCMDHAVGGAGTSKLRIQLSPDDLSTVIQTLDEHPDMRERMQQVELRPDTSVERGQVRVETGAGSLFYDPEEVLTRISDELRRAEREARGGTS